MRNTNAVHRTAIGLTALCATTAFGSLYDYSYSGTMENLESFEITIRMDTDVPPLIARPIGSTWLYSGPSIDEPQFLISASMTINATTTLFDSDYMSQVLQIVSFRNDPSVDSTSDVFTMGFSALGGDSEESLEITLFSATPDSSLTGTDLPLTSAELDPSSFDTTEFSYTDAGGFERIGTIDTVTVTSVAPSPGGLGLISFAGLMGSRRRRN